MADSYADLYGSDQTVAGTTALPSTALPSTVPPSMAQCNYRLPCGFCQILNRACPMGGNYQLPYYQYEITCASIKR